MVGSRLSRMFSRSGSERAKHALRSRGSQPSQAEETADRESPVATTKPVVHVDKLPPRVPETGTSADVVNPLPRPAEPDAPLVDHYWGA